MEKGSDHLKRLVTWPHGAIGWYEGHGRMTIPAIDLFAGPGGLNEGFSSFKIRKHRPFRTVGSFEMDEAACTTLRIRATFRLLDRRGRESYYSILRSGSKPDQVLRALSEHPSIRHAWAASGNEIHRVELGGQGDDSHKTIRAALEDNGVLTSGRWVLVGGPPCQAYSLAGRSRRANDETFADDKKHFLYREYLSIIREFTPAVFVMENVKGLLSSTHSGTGMFQKILEDLRKPIGDVHYRIYSFSNSGEPESLHPEDFIIRSEDYGIPQRRHRVILLGVRSDSGFPDFRRLQRHADSVTVQDAIWGLPPLRSRVSREPDSLDKWRSIRRAAASEHRFPGLNRRRDDAESFGGPWVGNLPDPVGDPDLANWLEDASLGGVIQHETRRHMRSDLHRYWFAAGTARVEGSSPTLRHFPKELQPAHKNAEQENRPFEDRFRVQVLGEPASTVVSHIA